MASFIKNQKSSLRFIAILLLLIFLSATNSYADPDGSISGNVTDAADGALPYTWVKLYDSAGNVSADTFSDESGNYTFNDVASGAYYIQYNLTGFQSVWYNDASTRLAATPIIVTAPDAITGINVKLGVGGSISGNVTDASDVALMSVLISLYDSVGNFLGDAVTDGSGDYTINVAASGAYYIQFSNPGMEPVWYNGATTLQKATPIIVTAPEAITGVNGRLVNYKLECVVDGTGGGTITSAPAGISCENGKTEGCLAFFDITKIVTLHVAANSTSTFSGWSGDCTAFEICALDMSTSHNVTATFTAAPKAKIGDSGYNSLNLAYAEAETVSEIHAMDTELIEDLMVDGKTITLKGGYKADYSELSGLPTVLKGVLSVRSGKLSISNFTIKQVL